MKRLILLILLLPILAQAQIYDTGTLQRNRTDSTVRGNFGSRGLMMIPTVSTLGTNGQILVFNSATNKYVPTSYNPTPDSTVYQTVANFFPKGDTRYIRGSMTTGTIPISNGTRSVTNSTITDNSTNIVLGSRGLAIGSIPASGGAALYLVQSSSVAGGVASRAASAVLADIGGLSPTGSGASLTNVVNSITGTANQVIASASTGAVTLSLPQSIATSSTPTFSALNVSTTVAAGAGTFNRTTAGSSVSLGNTNQFTQLDFSNSGTVKAAQYWDNTNTKMFFDANAPHIFTRTNAGSSLQLNNNTQFTQFDFLNNGTAKSSIYWDNTGQILNFFNANLGMQITNSGIIAFPALTGSVTDMMTITASGVVGRATIPSGGGGGSVTTIGVTTANGLGGTSSGGATPSLTLNTNVVGMVKANGTAFSAATAGTDYVTPSGSGTLSNKTLSSNTIAVTQTAGDNSTKIATTAYVDAAILSSDYLPFTQFSGAGATSGTLSVGFGAKMVAFLVHNGTTTTAILPAVVSTATAGSVAYIKNRGSGNITINSNAGGNDIYATSAVNTYSVTPGSSIIISFDGTYFNIL